MPSASAEDPLYTLRGYPSYTLGGMSAQRIMRASAVAVIFAVLVGVFGMHVLPAHGAAVGPATAHGHPLAESVRPSHGALQSARTPHGAPLSGPHGGSHGPDSGVEGDHEVCVARPAQSGGPSLSPPAAAGGLPVVTGPAGFACGGAAAEAHDAGRSPPSLHQLSILRV